MKKYILVAALLSVFLNMACSNSHVRSLENSDLTSAKSNRWKYIVIHHSGSPCDNARCIHHYHKHKGFGGMAYHFLINNGCGNVDGTIETGYRWMQKLQGGHVKVSQMEYNRHGIGICLVGNLNNRAPTKKQMYALAWLTVKLMKQYGISVHNIKGHREVPLDRDPDTVPRTDCPGKQFDMDRFRLMCGSIARKVKSAGFGDGEFRKIYRSFKKNNKHL